MNSHQNLSTSGNDLLFSDGAPSPSASSRDLPPWKIMVIDDDQVVHDVSRMVLRSFTYKGRGLEFIHGYSGKEARELLQQHPDTAVMFLDVVMESDSAGLETVQYIRDELKNRHIRIILRTGQPGQAPEHKVIRLYDINDYLEKSNLTAQYLEIALITSLRSYDDICTISQLTTDNDTLEALVKARTEELTAANAKLLEQMREQIRAHEALKTSEARLAEAQRIARIGHFEWHVGSDEMVWSSLIYRILGLDQADASPHTLKEFLQFVPEEELTQVEQAMAGAVRNKSSYTVEHSLKLQSGALRHVRHQGELALDPGANGSRVIGTLQDITERRQAEDEMRKLSLAIEQTADGIMITGKDGVIEYVNQAMTAMTGYSREELIGQTPRILKSDKQSSTFYYRLWRTISRGEVFTEIMVNRHKSGRLYYEEKTITPQKNEKGEVISYISSGKDITERMEAQQQLQFLAHHDALTGLPNRTLFQDRLTQAIYRARWRERKVAVLFLDIDRFKIINDSLGHHNGDTLLKEVASRLGDCVREGDSLSRLGGDEFIIVLNDVASAEDLPSVVDKILSKLSEPFMIRDRELFITSSIGISLYPDDGENGQTLLKKADSAMYRAKREGKNGYQFYTQEDEQQAIKRLSMESELRRALERDEFLLYYQPQLKLSSCLISGYEALLRWRHPHDNLISPVHFIPILEETGMIIQVGEWVLQTACAQERANQQAGHTPKRVAVNVSIHQFRHKDFVAMVKRTLDSSGLDPRHLELEVTEGVFIDDIKETSAKLHQLHDLGIALSIDDFGTGYSSMNYLRRLPFDALKIDRSFITEITTNSDDGAIAAAIVTLAHSIGLEVIAEGVETTEQLMFLDKLGCDMIQGYLCSPPQPADAFKTLEEDQYESWKSYLSHCDR